MDHTKTAIIRVAFGEGHELGPFGCRAVAVTPGRLRSEMMLEAFGVSEDNWPDATRRPAVEGEHDRADLAISETPASSNEVTDRGAVADYR